MTFLIVLTVLFAMEIGVRIVTVDQPRKPITGGDVIMSIVANGILIYGLWNWI